MHSFRQFLEGIEYLKNPIPLSSTHTQDKMNLDGLVSAVEKKTKRDKKHRDIDVEYAVRTGKLRATQDHLTTIGGGDPVFDHLKDPVVAEKDGVGHILDGHHRLARAYENKKTVRVHWVET